jgi:hypothetical protein
MRRILEWWIVRKMWPPDGFLLGAFAVGGMLVALLVIHRVSE